jgi:hypothetical protein
VLQSLIQRDEIDWNKRKVCQHRCQSQEEDEVFQLVTVTSTVRTRGRRGGGGRVSQQGREGRVSQREEEEGCLNERRRREGVSPSSDGLCMPLPPARKLDLLLIRGL